MYDPKFSIKQMYDQYGSSRTSSSSTTTTAGPRGYTRKSTPAPTPKQRTDRGYVPTNIAAPKSTSRTDRTAPPRAVDYSKGLGSRAFKPKTEELSTWEKVKSAFTNTMETFGIFDEPDTTTTPDAVYKDGNLFSPEPYIPDTSRFKGDTQLTDMTPAILKDYGSIYKREGDISPTLPTDTDNPILNVFGVERGFTRSPAGPQDAPTMDQPEMPDTFKDSIQKAIASALVPRRDTKEYTIKAGDTLSEIAEREGTTVKALADMNDIPESDVDMIRAGETLKIPAKSLTDTQAALRRGFDKPKDTEGVETAGLLDLLYGKKEAPQEVTFLNNENTTRGTREKIAYDAAYDAGLRGQELRAYMAQVAHETSNYGLLKELGYTSVASAVSVNGKKWANRLKRDNVVDPSDRDAETSGPVQENTAENIFNSVYANRNGNGDFQSGDGFKYRGRGYIQLTGRSNYKQIGEDIGVDLENNPELMENPVVAAKASAAWWKRNVRGKVPKNDYSNTYAVSGLVNRGSASKKANGLEDRKKAYQSYKPLKIDTSIKPKVRPKGLGAK